MPEIDIIDRAHELLTSEYESEPADDVVRGLIAEVLALRGVTARSDAVMSALIRANGRWSTLAGFLYGVVEMTCDGHAMQFARKKWEEAHAANHD
jgi:hypothetical protein